MPELSRTAAVAADDAPLRIAYLTYRGKPHVGGQGVYTRHLTKALVDLGHAVEVFGGQPYPILDERVELHKLPSLDIFNDHYPGRFPAYWELKSKADVVETLSHLRGTFSEPLAFSVRARDELKQRTRDFDLVHDNQCLGYGDPRHREDDPDDRHPAPPDHQGPRAGDGPRQDWRKRRSVGRWYSFVKMQGRVAQQMPRIVVVSENSIKDIHADMGVSHDRMRLVPVGVDPALFKPLPGRGPPSRPADHHRVGRRRAEGPVVPARGDGQAAHRARRRPPDDHRQAARRAPATT